MAIQLYKKGNTHTVRGIECEIGTFDEYSYLHNLDNEWFYSPEECYSDVDAALAKKLAECCVVLEDPKENIRLIAKKAGIRNWHNKKIENIEKELEGVNYGNSNL